MINSQKCKQQNVSLTPFALTPYTIICNPHPGFLLAGFWQPIKNFVNDKLLKEPSHHLHRKWSLLFQASQFEILKGRCYSESLVHSGTKLIIVPRSFLLTGLTDGQDDHHRPFRVRVYLEQNRERMGDIEEISFSFHTTFGSAASVSAKPVQKHQLLLLNASYRYKVAVVVFRPLPLLPTNGWFCLFF